MTQQLNSEYGNDSNSSLGTADLARTGAAEETRRASRDAKDSEAGRNDGERAALLPKGDCDRLRGEWDSIQSGFVDEPRQAVEHADNLVATTMKQLAETFAAERSRLEGAWDRGDDVSTEDLRVALQRYRSFFNRLLTV